MGPGNHKFAINSKPAHEQMYSWCSWLVLPKKILVIAMQTKLAIMMVAKGNQVASWMLELPSSDILVISWISRSSFLLKLSLRNSTAMKVRAEAGIYQTILGTLPLNIPLRPSAIHILLKASNHPLYLPNAAHVEKT